MASLVYHAINTSDQISPFDDAILRVAQTGSVKIVSPYIGLAYLKRIIDFSSDWMLISDIEAWLASLSARDRLMATAFIGKNKAHIHHVPSIHAKTVIGEHLAFLGSANLTTTGVLARSDSPRIEEVQALTRWLDGEESRSTTGKPAPPLSSVSRKVSAILSSVEDVRPLVSDISRERAADVQSDLSRVVLESTKNGPPMDTGWTGLTPAERSDAKNASTVPLVVENVMYQGLAVSPRQNPSKLLQRSWSCPKSPTLALNRLVRLPMCLTRRARTTRPNRKRGRLRR